MANSNRHVENPPASTVEPPFDPHYHWLGIPPRDQPPDHYRLLGIELFEANDEVIAHAADRQMGHVRTFQTGVHGQASQQLLNQIAAARRCLLDRQKKLAYDVELAGRNLIREEQNVDGSAFGEYLLLDVIDRGCLGTVFKAKHRTMGRVIALRVLSSEAAGNPLVTEQFCRHVSLLARLHHPNLITAFDAGNRAGRPYLTMEFVDGQRLDEFIKSTPLPGVSETVNCIKQAAGGLAYVHQQGVAHGAICPPNLLISHDHVVKLTGFGGACFFDAPDSDANNSDPAGAGSSTPGSRRVGEADFAAPEQFLVDSRIDAQTDIYGLGCTLYSALTGEPPFHGLSSLEKVRAHQQKPLPRIRDRRPDVPVAIDEVLVRMTAKTPADRFRSMYDVIMALTEAMRSSPPTPPGPPTSEPPHPTQSLDGLDQIARSDVPRWKRKR